MESIKDLVKVVSENEANLYGNVLVDAHTSVKQEMDAAVHKMQYFREVQFS